MADVSIRMTNTSGANVDVPLTTLLLAARKGKMRRRGSKYYIRIDDSVCDVSTNAVSP